MAGTSVTVAVAAGRAGVGEGLLVDVGVAGASVGAGIKVTVAVLVGVGGTVVVFSGALVTVACIDVPVVVTCGDAVAVTLPARAVPVGVRGGEVVAARGVSVGTVDGASVGTIDGVAVGAGGEGICVGVASPGVGDRVGTVCRWGCWVGVAHTARTSDPRTIALLMSTTKAVLPDPDSKRPIMPLLLTGCRHLGEHTATRQLPKP